VSLPGSPRASSRIRRSATGALALAVTSALALTGCTGGPSADTASNGCAVSASGSASDAVKATGKLGAEPKVTFTKGLSPEKTERTATVAGDGAAAEENSSVAFAMSVYNGSTGKKIDAAGYDGELITETIADGKLIPGLYTTLQCSTEGSRVVGVVPPADGFGDTGQESLGITADDSLVFVIDVMEVSPLLAKANGKAQPAEEGFPTVKLAQDGEPTITIPKGDPPAELKIAVLKQGEGAEVAASDTVTIHYSGVLWRTGEGFDSSWEKGAPYPNTASGFVPGFSTAIIGQKVGSQIIVIVPPEEGYGAQGNGDILGTDTMVFVVDILATARA